MTACSFACSYSWTLQIVLHASQEWKKLRLYVCRKMLFNCLHTTFLLIYFWMTWVKLQRGSSLPQPPLLQVVKITLNPKDNGFQPVPPVWCQINIFLFCWNMPWESQAKQNSHRDLSTLKKCPESNICTERLFIGHHIYDIIWDCP